MKKILLVEDSKVYNHTLSTLLQNSNLDVVSAFTLKEASTYLQKENFDYLILDLILPDGEGDDLLNELSNLNKNNFPKTIILSSAHDIQRRNYLFEHGIIDFFSKSDSINDIATSIINLIEEIENNNNKNIIIIDDSKFIRKNIKDILHSKSYNIIEFSNAPDAINYILDNIDEVDLIYTDIEMPDMNGIEFLKRLKNNKKTSNIPIIVLSSISNREQYASALKNGAVDFLKKPFLVEEILLKTDLHIKQSEAIKKIHQQAQELKEYKRALSESDIISKTDPKGKITHVNDLFCKISGYTEDELIGKNHNLVRHPDTPKSLFKELWQTISNKQTFKRIIKNKKKNGESYYVDATISPILNLKGEIVEYLAIRHDVTEIMNPQKQLLDDLNNLDSAILILMQISNYDILKEFYSEDIRSKFEKEFAKILLDLFPEYTGINKTYILGNGLFGFLKNQYVEAQTIDMCLRGVLENFKKQDLFFEGDKYELDMAISFANNGKYLFDDVILGIDESLKSEKNNIVYADNYYRIKQIEARSKLKILKAIRESLKEEDKILSFYQPIIDNTTKEIIKYESLVRLKNHKNEILSPFYFLDLAKKTGYYHDITKKVIDNSIKILNEKDINITINLSLSDIENLEIRTKLLDLIHKSENFGRITFELLEDEVANDFETIFSFIGIAKEIGGITIAIDDFGSGYSNYERLLKFQPDYIKIDGSLISNIKKDEYTKSVVKSIILFAKENHLKTIAEFVKDEEIYNIVKDLGIDYSQGYYFSEPIQL